MSRYLEDQIHFLKNEIYQLRQVLDGVDINIYWKDIKGRYLGMNRANAVSLKISDVSSILGKGEIALISDKKKAQQIVDNDLEVFKSGIKQSFIEQYPTGEDNTYKIVMSKKTCIRDDNGHLIGLVGVSIDI